MVWIRNLYSDGRPDPKPEVIKTEKDGKAVNEYIYTEDPSYPKVIIESVDYEAPYYPSWPPERHTRLLPVRPASRAEETEVARAALAAFMDRAFRRPADPAGVDEMARYFTKVRPLVDSFEQAIRETFAMVLVSPDFLYLVERAEPAEKRIDDYELASRLSYFLWSTMPDERLLELASQGRLSAPEGLTAEVERMLDDERSWAFVEQFSNQWLDLDGVDRVAVNPNYYPDFDESLKADMRGETQHFFAEVLENDLSALTFLRSDFAMLNQALAQHYGINGPRTEAFERVPLRFEDRRGGLLAQASILLTNSTGEDSHPINRGVWVRKVLFDDPPPPPPPAVPNLDSSAPGLALMPLKRQLEEHRDNAACVACHQGIDPWGVALEEFDAVGQFRTRVHRRSGEQEAVNPVDAAATLPDGAKVNGFNELAAYLVEHKAQAFGRALTSKMLAYALGRSLELEDQREVDRLAEEFAADGYRFRRHVVRIATSSLFQQH
jgi:hypothetical protein